MERETFKKALEFGLKDMEWFEKYWLTWFAAIVIAYDLISSYIAVKRYGFVEINPIYHIGGFPLLALLNAIGVFIIFLLEAHLIPRDDLVQFRNIVFLALVGRAGIVTGLLIAGLVRSL